MKRQSEKMVAGGFVLALLVLCGVAMGSYLSVQNLIASRRSVEHTFEVLGALDRIFNGSTTFAGARYGYVISREKTYLSDYEAGLQATEQGMQAVRRLTIDNPGQQRRLAALEPLIAQRMALAQRSITLLQQGQSNDALQADLSNQGLLLARQVRQLLTTMKDEELRLLQQRKVETDESVRQAILVNGVGYLVGFSLLVGVFVMLHRQIRIRYQAEAALQKHSEEVSDLYNHAPCGYHSLDGAGTFIRINDTELDWLGYTRNEVVAQKTFAEIITAESVVVFQGIFPRFKEQGWISDVEFELVRKDGTLLPVSLSATAIKDAEGNFLMSRSTLFDIRERKRGEAERKRAQDALQQANEQLEQRVQERTAALSQVNALLHSELLDRKQAEQALSANEKQLRTITNALPVLIAYIDAERRYRFNNQTYEQWFGCDWTGIYGRHLSDVVGELAYQNIEPYAKRVLSGQTVTYEDCIPYKDGGRRWVSASYLPDMDEQGTVRGYVALVSDITDRKQAEEALRESKERLSFALETAEMGDWDLTLRDRTAQRSLRHDQIFGYDCLQPEWTYETFLSHVLLDDRAAVNAKFGAALTNGELWDFECRIRRVDEVTRWIWARGHLYQDAQGNDVRMLGLIADITDRKQAEEALRQSEERLYWVLQNMPVMLDAFDPDWNVIIWNRECEEVTGYAAAEIVGNPNCLELLYPDLDYRQQMVTAWANRGHHYRNWEWDMVCKDGSVKTISWSNISEQFPIPGWATWGVGVDVTDRKQAEHALQNLNEALEIKVQERTVALNQLNEDLMRSNQELEQFAYIASHDLQEPLRAIMGYTQLLTQDYRDRLDDTAQGYGGYIVDGAQRMQQLIQDLLRYSRVGTRDLVFAPTDCNAVLAQVLGNLQVAIAESIAIITSDPLPTVTADQTQLVQLLQNLIGNAIKFCREEQPQVHVSAVWQDDAWRFGVHDHGIGIKPRYLERIFEIFKRLHTRTEFPGTGIGLAICKKIVDRHNGRIWAESESGTGTTFYFTLPHQREPL